MSLNRPSALRARRPFLAERSILSKSFCLRSKLGDPGKHHDRSDYETEDQNTNKFPPKNRDRELLSIALYMDVHIRRAITEGLRRSGVDVLTAQEDGCAMLADPDLLDRATNLGRVLFSMDDYLLTEATMRQAASIQFAGVIYAHQLRITVG